MTKTSFNNNKKFQRSKRNVLPTRSRKFRRGRQQLPDRPMNRILNPWNSLWLTSEIKATSTNEDSGYSWSVSDISSLFTKTFRIAAINEPPVSDIGQNIRIRLHQIDVWSWSGVEFARPLFLTVTPQSLVNPTVIASGTVTQPSGLKTIESCSQNLRPAKIRYRWPKEHRQCVFDCNTVKQGDTTPPGDYNLWVTTLRNDATKDQNNVAQVTHHILISWQWLRPQHKVSLVKPTSCTSTEDNSWTVLMDSVSLNPSS